MVIGMQIRQVSGLRLDCSVNCDGEFTISVSSIFASSLDVRSFCGYHIREDDSRLVDQFSGGSIRGHSQVVDLGSYNLHQVSQVEDSSIAVGVVQKELCRCCCRTLSRLSQLRVVSYRCAFLKRRVIIQSASASTATTQSSEFASYVEADHFCFIRS